jgi:hypothetical protein
MPAALKEPQTMTAPTQAMFKSKHLTLCSAMALLAAIACPQAASAWTSTIDNKLSVPLTNRDIENRQSMQWKTKPPETIAAGSNATFSMKQGTSGKVDRLKIRYTIGDTTDWVEILIQDTICTAKTSSDQYDGSVDGCKGGSTFTYKDAP